MALLSPSVEPFLEEMAQQAHRLTVERFGKVMQLYIPLYLSNYCQNVCTYCGFNINNKLQRKILSLEEVQLEVNAIKQMRYKHILLVSGEAKSVADAQYFENIVKLIRQDFAQIAIEVQPLKTQEYSNLKQAGVGFLCVYQETYSEDNYKLYHLKGNESKV